MVGGIQGFIGSLNSLANDNQPLSQRRMARAFNRIGRLSERISSREEKINSKLESVNAKYNKLVDKGRGDSELAQRLGAKKERLEGKLAHLQNKRTQLEGLRTSLIEKNAEDNPGGIPGTDPLEDGSVGDAVIIETGGNKETDAGNKSENQEQEETRTGPSLSLTSDKLRTSQSRLNEINKFAISINNDEDRLKKTEALIEEQIEAATDLRVALRHRPDDAGKEQQKLYDLVVEENERTNAELRKTGEKEQDLNVTRELFTDTRELGKYIDEKKEQLDDVQVQKKDLSRTELMLSKEIQSARKEVDKLSNAVKSAEEAEITAQSLKQQIISLAAAGDESPLNAHALTPDSARLLLE
jgi:chromosome segregation ATPase